VTVTRIFDYDQLDVWGPWFTPIMLDVAGPEIIKAAKDSRPEYLEDARQFFQNEIGLQKLVDELNTRLSAYAVRVYHGTRLGDGELTSVKRHGLRPLTLVDRKDLLIRCFKHHPDWEKERHKLDGILHRIGPGWEKSGYGKREDGGIHVCLSRAGLLHGANHYLTHGAEVDHHVAYALFENDKSAENLLRVRRPARLISFTAPFPEAAGAANPWGFRQDEMPSLLSSLFQAWAFSLSHPSFKIANERDSVALRFPGPISADRLEIEDILDDVLDRRDGH
jgi:hypothetical protein